MEPLRKIKINPQSRWAIAIAAVATLSISHHLINFWGLPLTRLILVLLCIPPLTFLFKRLLSVIWDVVPTVSQMRWSAFLLTALPISLYFTWQLFEFPIVWHRLEIIPLPGAQHPIRIVEIKESDGSSVKFSRLNLPTGWTRQDNMLVSDPSNLQPFSYQFEGPVHQPITLIFQTDAQGGAAEILLDGIRLTVELADPDEGLRSVQMDTRYRFGIPGAAMAWVTALLDFLTLLAVLTYLFLIHERQQMLERQLAPQIISHRSALTLLIGLGLALHSINFLSTPLHLDVDSPSYLSGAVHWLQYRNFDGVSPFRGPGTTLLFIPVLSIFGRNPWGMKALLHILALACIPLTYWLAWQLRPRAKFAFGAGLLAALTPDLYFYSNYVMSEIPNIFFLLLYCTFLLAAIKTLHTGWITASLLTGSFLILLRSENLIVQAIGGGFLLLKILQEWFASRRVDKHARASVFLPFLSFAVAGVFSIFPILGWAAHNQRVHGFFGLSNYGGEVFYTGWVYQAEASHIPFADPHSPAVQLIREAYWNRPDVSAEVVPTGWEIYPYLKEKGYEDAEIFAILQQAAVDSIKKDYRTTMKVLALKLKDGFVPETTATLTLALPGETVTPNKIKAEFFDEEGTAPFPVLVSWQRKVYDLLAYHYAYIYPVWVWLCLGATFYSLYRRPSLIWLPIVLITLTRAFLPPLIGLSHWRPVVSGILLLQVCGLAGLQTLWTVFTDVFRKSK
ncbi:MAG TPA: phospholipid carrier-dependent glycosyltransferase [Anaerolineales bacterium]|nr:phospholipid carrier-dependent glycosyltransferase [Anaerolineales bacterium]